MLLFCKGNSTQRNVNIFKLQINILQKRTIMSSRHIRHEKAEMSSLGFYDTIYNQVSIQCHKLYISLILESASNSSIDLKLLLTYSDLHQDTVQETEEIYLQK